MSWSNRRSLLALLAAAPLAACGFTPAYSPNGPAKALRGRISYQAPTDPNSFELVKQLEVQFGRPEAATHSLRYSLTVGAQAGGFTTANTITRYVLNGSAVWSLDEIATGQRTTGGTATGFTSWSAAGTTISTQVASDDATRRLMVILADQIATQLLAATVDMAP
jgi:LPS-assembly lipoprotein